eukprot:1331380-Pleurochrysis_carterae.AAC.1
MVLGTADTGRQHGMHSLRNSSKAVCIQTKQHVRARTAVAGWGPKVCGLRACPLLFVCISPARRSQLSMAHRPHAKLQRSCLTEYVFADVVVCQVLVGCRCAAQRETALPTEIVGACRAIGIDTNFLGAGHD